jgi:hypothetical protein
MTVNVTPDVIFQGALPALVELSIAGLAWLVCFRSSTRRQSPGLFLISLGFFVMLIIEGSWQVFYWFILGGVYEFAVFIQTGIFIEQFSQIADLTGWISIAIYSVSFALMALLVTLGARRILEERKVATT